MEEYRLKIGKMSCVNCANAIENATRKLEGVEDAQHFLHKYEWSFFT